MNWEFLINEDTFARFIPEMYAHYRRPLLLALTSFLEGLPAGRQEAIANEQATLPATATVLERLVRLAWSCPVLHKLGQTLARDRNLPVELRRGLQRLESVSPSIPMEAVERVLTQELGPLDRLGVTLLPALAEASVAIVVPFRFSRGEALSDGVFKVLKPGIEERLEEDLRLLGRVGALLDESCEDLRIPHLDYRESFERVESKLRNEVRLDVEQHNLSLASEFHKGDRRVLIPALFDFCTRRVTAMERVEGRKVTDRRRDSPGGKMRMARLVIETSISRPVFSMEPQALFHGDPHAGNLFSTEDRRLAVLDWSLIGMLGEKERVSIMQIILGAMAFRAEKIIAAISGLSMERPIDLPALGPIVHKWIGRIQDGQLPGFTWLTGLLDDAVQNAGLRLGADLMLFRRAIHMVEGVVADIGGGTGLIDQVFLSELALHFSAELPRRFLTPPDCRAFATRISNTDLAELMLSFPWGAVQFWLDRNRDLANFSGCVTGLA